MTRNFICPLCYKKFPMLAEYLAHVKKDHADFGVGGRTPFPENREHKNVK